MSWQAYIDENLIGSGFMHSACIIGLEDSSYWAYGGTYIPQPDEVEHIQRCLADLSLSQMSGVPIYGVKFFGLQSGKDGEGKFIFFKKGGAGGCVFTSKQTIIIGVYGNPSSPSGLQKDMEKQPSSGADVNPADCNAAVKAVADYLISLGY